MEFSGKLGRILRHYTESLALRNEKSRILVRVVGENALNMEHGCNTWCLRIHTQYQLRFLQLFILATLAQQYDIEIVSVEGTPRSLHDVTGGLTSIFKSLRLDRGSKEEGVEDREGQFWSSIEEFTLAFDILKGIVLFE